MKEQDKQILDLLYKGHHLEPKELKRAEYLLYVLNMQIPNY